MFKPTLLLLALSIGLTTMAQREIPLYPSNIPNSKPCDTVKPKIAQGQYIDFRQPAFIWLNPKRKTPRSQKTRSSRN